MAPATSLLVLKQSMCFGSRPDWAVTATRLRLLLIAVVAPQIADGLVAAMKRNRYGSNACVIGEVRPEPQGIVAMRTGFGGTRIVDMLVGDQLPRIC